MKSRTRWAYAASAATALLLTASACTGGEDDPTVSPTGAASSTPSSSSSSSRSPSVSASTTPSASASASVEIPAAARANTDAGAIAFVRFWFEQVNTAYTKPDATLIPAISLTTCKSCTDIAGEPREYVALGHRMSTRPIEPLTNLRILGGGVDGDRRVSFTLTQNAVQVVDSTGKSVDTQPAAEGTRLALVSWKEGRWYLAGLAAPA